METGNAGSGVLRRRRLRGIEQRQAEQAVASPSFSTGRHSLFQSPFWLDLTPETQMNGATQAMFPLQEEFEIYKNNLLHFMRSILIKSAPKLIINK